MLVVLSGGTGGAKLIEGLSHEIDAAQLTVVCNTADDFVLHGLNISPDLDTILYTLAGMSDSAKGWGIQDDTFAVLTQLEKLGGETWFKLGDRDIATHITEHASYAPVSNCPMSRTGFGTVSASKPDSSHVGRHDCDELRLQKGEFRFRNISSNGAGNRTLKRFSMPASQRAVLRPVC